MSKNIPTLITNYDDLLKFNVDELNLALKQAKEVKRDVNRKKLTDIINDMYISRLEKVIKSKK